MSWAMNYLHVLIAELPEYYYALLDRLYGRMVYYRHKMSRYDMVHFVVATTQDARLHEQQANKIVANVPGVWKTIR